MSWGDHFVSDKPSVRLVTDIDIVKNKIAVIEATLKEGRALPDSKYSGEIEKVKAALPAIEHILQNVDFDSALAAAYSCYSGDIVPPEIMKTMDFVGCGITPLPELMRELDANLEKKVDISKSIWQARHHTPFMHKNFTFLIDGVSRQAIWEFFHAHPFYNSEQVSQRYKKMSGRGVLTAKMTTDEAQSVADAAIKAGFDLYDKFRGERLYPVAAEEYFARFPGRTDQKSAKNDILKKTQEVARYFLPIGTQAHMYHSINSVTLARYWRLANLPSTSPEIRQIVGAMVDEVMKRDNLLTGLFDEPIDDLDDLLEVKASKARGPRTDEQVRKFTTEFDACLGDDRRSRLVGYDPKAAAKMADAVRDVLGMSKNEMMDVEALRIVCDPSYNKQRSEVLTLDHMQPLARAKYAVQLLFAVKLSHTADSQAQRQRMSPATRPRLEDCICSTPDFITPALVKASGADAVSEYEDGMQRIWGYRNKLLDLGEPAWKANLLLPNALAIRYHESVDLLNFMQKDEKRECLNAQEEIGNITIQQRQDVESVYPGLKGFFGPPCCLRFSAGIGPPCPEGDRFCGVPTWRALIEDDDGKQMQPEYDIAKLMRERKI